MMYVSRVRVLVVCAVLAVMTVPLAGCDEDDGPTAPERCATPTFTPPGGTYRGRVSVEIRCATPVAAIRYTTDGTVPIETSTYYYRPIQVSDNATFTARAWKEGYTKSEVATASYVIRPLQVATPTFDPPPGEYVGSQRIRIRSATHWATIRYTLDGSDPDEDSPVHLLAIELGEDTTIKAKAWRTSYDPSEIAVGQYKIEPIHYVSIPTFDPQPGSYVDPQNVTITSATEGATIRYTIDGKYPGESSTLYERRIPVSDDMMIWARAWKAGLEPSDATACYSIDEGITQPDLVLLGSGGSPGDYSQYVLWLDDPDFAASAVSSEVLGPTSNTTEVANDFIIEWPGAIVQKVTWWGAYWNGFVTPRRSGFNLRFYADAGCRPDADPILEYLLPGNECYQSLAWGGDMVSQFIYERCVDLTVIPGVYWLSIQMADYCHNLPPQWGRLGADRTKNCSSCIRSDYFSYPQWAPVDSIIGADYDASVMIEDECIPTLRQSASWPSVKNLYR